MSTASMFLFPLTGILKHTTNFALLRGPRHRYIHREDKRRAFLFSVRPLRPPNPSIYPEETSTLWLPPDLGCFLALFLLFQLLRAFQGLSSLRAVRYCRRSNTVYVIASRASHLFAEDLLLQKGKYESGDCFNTGVVAHGDCNAVSSDYLGQISSFHMDPGLNCTVYTYVYDTMLFRVPYSQGTPTQVMSLVRVAESLCQISEIRISLSSLSKCERF
jgi:hypothetical protein